MKKNQNDPFGRYIADNLSGLMAVFVLVLMSFMVSSCSVIGDIFKAGMGVGIFAILAVLVVIVFVISRFRKK
jgi:hypothetical protein